MITVITEHFALAVPDAALGHPALPASSAIEGNCVWGGLPWATCRRQEAQNPGGSSPSQESPEDPRGMPLRTACRSSAVEGPGGGTLGASILSPVLPRPGMGRCAVSETHPYPPPPATWLRETRSSCWGSVCSPVKGSPSFLGAALYKG